MISIVMPCYNEELIIESSYIRLKEALEPLKGGYEILFADDGSTDNTLAVLKKIEAQDSSVKVLSYQPNRGAGYAHRQLYDSATGDIVITFEADLAIDPRDAIPVFLERILDYDLVIGSRYMGIKSDYPFHKKILSKCFVFLNRLLFRLPLKDTQSGFIAFRRNILDELELESNRWEIFLEFFSKAQAKGFRMIEVPLKFRHCSISGETSIISEGPRLVMKSIQLWWKLHCLSRYKPSER